MADTLKYVDATLPSNGDGSIGNPYNSMASFVANEAGPISAPDRLICNLRAPANDPDPSYINLSGFTGTGTLIIQAWDAPEKAHIQPGSGSGHAITYSSDSNFNIDLFDLRIDMIDMDGGSEEGIRMICGGSIERCTVCNGNGHVDMDGIHWPYNNTVSGTHLVRDTEVYNIARGGIFNQGAQNKTITCVNAHSHDIHGTAGRYSAIGFDGNFPANGSTMLVVGCIGHVSGSATCYSNSNTFNNFLAASTNNMSNDDSAELRFGAANNWGDVDFREDTGGTGDRAMFVSLSAPYDLRPLDDPANLVLDNAPGPTDPTHGSIVSPIDYLHDPRSGPTASLGPYENPPSAGAIEISSSAGYAAGASAQGGIPELQGAAQAGYSAGASAQARIPDMEGSAQAGYSAGASAQARIPDMEGSAQAGYSAGGSAQARIPDMEGSAQAGYSVGAIAQGDIETPGEVNVSATVGYLAGASAQGQIPELQGAISVGYSAGASAQGRIPEMQGSAPVGYSTGASAQGRIPELQGAISVGYSAGAGVQGGIPQPLGVAQAGTAIEAVAKARIPEPLGVAQSDVQLGVITQGAIPEMYGMTSVGLSIQALTLGRIPLIAGGAMVGYAVAAIAQDADATPTFFDVNEEVAFILQNDPQVVGLVASQIYNIFRPEINEQPSIVFRRTSTDPVQSSDGSNELVRAVYELDCYARQLNIAAEILRAAKNALIRVKHAQFLNRIDSWDSKEGSWKISADFSVWGYDRHQ